MKQILYDKDGNCSVCKGTNICLSCEGTGKHPFLKDTSCPTCKGEGDCICHGQKKNSSTYDFEKEMKNFKALCFQPKATKHRPLIE